MIDIYGLIVFAKVAECTTMRFVQDPMHYYCELPDESSEHPRPFSRQELTTTTSKWSVGSSAIFDARSFTYIKLL